jgi:putative heme-binding domain-containing protein
MKYLVSVLSSAVLLVLRAPCPAAEDVSSPPVLKVPDGFSIELVAGAPLVERPIVAAFDEVGHLYVAESSGTNDPVQKQLELRPHRIVRLDDSDGDGRFDRRTVFADQMMFPEGAMFLDGSLYVSAPPSIWKLTDTDGDGVADERSEWFQGKTLTGCANDLHGPYLGLDGWIYWCKGAFAEQTHMVHGKEWKTRAAHVFRCLPDGSGFEPVMTSGMDNPVDVTFMPDGERILSGTYFSGSPRHDGLAHVIYGGVYGKEQGALDGHPRTGELMPILVQMSPTAACGLERYDSTAFGDEFRDNLFCCQFNLRKVSRHILHPVGSSYTSEDSDFVTSENVDFHPTDVLVDADGSLLVIDTGAWYKLCCPTSQLRKPELPGGIYRVRRVGAQPTNDPRGNKTAWDCQRIDQLWELLGDERPAFRRRAEREIVRRRESPEVNDFIKNLAKRKRIQDLLHAPSTVANKARDDQSARLSRLWMLSQLENADSRAIMRRLLGDPDESVRHAALLIVGLYRDGGAETGLMRLLATDSSANRRSAAEALGRIGNPKTVSALLTAAARADDRILQHSITYALIELADPAATRAGLASNEPGTIAAALIALDQMPGGGIDAADVVPRLNANDRGLRHTARWIVGRHPDWGGELRQWFKSQLAALPQESQSDAAQNAAAELESLLTAFRTNPAIQDLIADTAQRDANPLVARELALRVMSSVPQPKPIPGWTIALTKIVVEANPRLLPLAVAAARQLPSNKPPGNVLDHALEELANKAEAGRDLRVSALAPIAPSLSELNDAQFNLLIEALPVENNAALRATATDALTRAQLTPEQLDKLCDTIGSSGPLEINRLLAPFAKSTDHDLGLKLLDALKRASALCSLRIDLVRQALADQGPAVQKQIDELESLVNVDASAQRRRIEELLPKMAAGDVRRGEAVYFSAKASCSVCHRLGHAGGTVGPDLSKIGEARTERDLLESILYPSLSFVRSYEPVLILTTSGQAVSGNIRNETAEEYVLSTGPDKEVRVRRDEVEELQPGTVSTMPAGLDQQFTVEQLADLVAFLKNTGH